MQKIIKELEQVSSFVSNGGQSYDYGIHIDREDLQKINKLTKQIDRRLKGEHLAETDKFYAYWAIATKQESVEDRYSWENLYQPDPQTKKLQSSSVE